VTRRYDKYDRRVSSRRPTHWWTDDKERDSGMTDAIPLDVFPLSRLQDNLIGDNGKPKAWIRFLLRLDGRIDPAVLERAIASLLQKWEALRCNYRLLPNGSVAQEIWPNKAIQILEMPAFDDHCAIWSLSATQCESTRTALRVSIGSDANNTFLLFRLPSATIDHVGAALLARDLRNALEGKLLPTPRHYTDIVDWLSETSAIAKASHGLTSQLVHSNPVSSVGRLNFCAEEKESPMPFLRVPLSIHVQAALESIVARYGTSVWL